MNMGSVLASARVYSNCFTHPRNLPSMTTIIGVDFSGARSDNKTWIAQGRLDSDDALLLHGVQPIRRDDLHDLLAAIPTPAVAALDFPFGVPRQFAEHVGVVSAPHTMSGLWNIISTKDIDDFIGERNQFVAEHGEPRRAGDLKYHRESYSPLHNVNPNMLPMTYHGIRLLHRWHQRQPRRWHVPPLRPGGPPSETVTLLELMPGAFLRSIGLPYKGYKKGQRALQLRDEILDSLVDKSGVSITNLPDVRDDCRSNDDCLDAMVAAVGAAAWARDPSRFRHPTDDELPDARLEGWIYVPGAAKPIQ